MHFFIAHGAARRYIEIVAMTQQQHHTLYRHSANVNARIVLVTGQHGHEILGMELGDEIVDVFCQTVVGFELVLFDRVNTWGIEHNTRQMANGQDMNRAWRGPVSPRDSLEREVWAACQTGIPTLLLDLHNHKASRRVWTDGSLGQAVAPFFEGIKAHYWATEGSLAFVAESLGIHALTVEATTGEPIGDLPELVWAGMLRWAATVKATKAA